MVASRDRKYMTPQEYLEWEEQQDIKYEYINFKFHAEAQRRGKKRRYEYIVLVTLKNPRCIAVVRWLKLNPHCRDGLC